MLNDVRWFRGRESFFLPLGTEPSPRKQNWLAKELPLFKQFRRKRLGTLTCRATDWDWLLLMQHYGVPTRLLDWTETL